MLSLLTRSLVVLCLAAVSVPPAIAQSLLDSDWVKQATPAAVQALLDRGADPNARSNGDPTPLHWAALLNENPAVVALLLDRGAAINARCTLGQTPLHWAAARNENPAVIALLLDRGADVNTRDEAGWPPLHEAVRRKENSAAVVALLLDRGADINVRDKYGRIDNPAPCGAHKPLSGGGRPPARPRCFAHLTGPVGPGRSCTRRRWGTRTRPWPRCCSTAAPMRHAATKKASDPLTSPRKNEHLNGTNVYWRLNDASY